MIAGRRIAVVVPAYNEARLIGATLRGVPGFVDDIIVVDDGSTDASAEIALAFDRAIEVIRHPCNQGVGAAIATGCNRALSLGAEITAVMAADGQMDPLDLPALLAPLLSGQADYVKGNRLGALVARDAMPWHRWLGNHVFSWLTRRAIGVSVQDSQCGYAAMNRRAKEAIQWERLWKSYGYPNDLLSLATLCGLRVRDVPVRPIYGSEQSGIRLRHVLLIVPFVIARAWFRTHWGRRGTTRRQPRSLRASDAGEVR
jgi:glycosyltransferase involved in cell wall biosynthesis